MTYIYNRTITVKWFVDGFHRWPHATRHRAYLGDRHRHRFGFSVTVPVGHNERDIEFHDLLDYCTGLFMSPYEFGDRSCETIATEVCANVTNQFGVQHVTVSVDEDGYVTATVEATKT